MNGLLGKNTERLTKYGPATGALSNHSKQHGNVPGRDDAKRDAQHDSEIRTTEHRPSQRTAEHNSEVGLGVKHMTSFNSDDWKSGWEKNADSAIKAVKKLSDDIKALGKNQIPDITRRKFQLNLELLETEVAELKESFGKTQE